MHQKIARYFFKCSVSENLYGVSANADGSPLPTPGGGNWTPVKNLSALGIAAKGYIHSESEKEILEWGCHWFTSNGSRDIYWGPNGYPKQ